MREVHWHERHAESGEHGCEKREGVLQVPCPSEDALARVHLRSLVSLLRIARLLGRGSEWKPSGKRGLVKRRELSVIHRVRCEQAMGQETQAEEGVTHAPSLQRGYPHVALSRAHTMI